MMERLDVIGWFLVALVIALAIWRKAHAYFEKESDDEYGIGLGEDAGTPEAVDLRAAARARQAAGLRDRAAFHALCLRLEQRRRDHQRIRPFLCGPPVEDESALDLDALTVAADRLRGQIDILREIRAPDHIIAIAERVAAADRLKQSGRQCPKDAA